MRIQLLLATIAGLSGSLAACSWTTFDDLKDEAWVNATEKPDNGSTNWGLAIQRSKLTSASGGRLTVLGTAASVYNEIEYSATGGAKIAGSELDLGDLGIANLEAQPILLADPSKDDISLVTKRGPQEVLVLEGSQGQLVPHQVFGADSADAATYMVAPGFDGAVDPQPPQPIVAAIDTLYGTFFNPPMNPFMQPKCRLLDGGGNVAITALGSIRLATKMTDDVVVWAQSGGMGKLYIVDGQVFNGAKSSGVCPDGDADGTGDYDLATAGPGGTPVPQLDVGFSPEIGSQILVFEDHFAVLQGHNNQSGASFLGVVDLGDGVANPTLVGNPQNETGLKAAAVADFGQLAVAAGYPGASIDGVNCGKVVVYPLSSATGIAASPIELLHDAQPDDGQSFGRAIAAMPFNGQQILAVGANNEIYTYFRTTTLYPVDTRQGR